MTSPILKTILQESTHRGDFAIHKAVLENLHKHLFVLRCICICIAYK